MNTQVKKGTVKTVSFDGIDVFETNVECHFLPGIPSFTIVGLGDKTIAESRERIKSALFSSGFQVPNAKIIINLSPASRYKEGSHYDLPIALSILMSIGELSYDLLQNSIVMGELGLNGQILPVNGVLPSVIFSRNHHYNFVGSPLNQQEMILPIDYTVGIDVLSLVENLKTRSRFFPEKIEEPIISYPDITLLDSIYGQKIGKRAVLIAAAGRHNLMFIGEKGVGKSLLSRSVLDLLPDLSEKESLETTSIHSIAGYLNDHKLVTKPPFRSPHSSCSLISLIGGGSIPKPGEISLAHNGILFLDELPEFFPQVIDSLRTPIEERQICISRAKYKIVYPANFQLIVSMNPCKCGNLFTGNCKCNNKNYMYKVSAPIQDRIDLKVVLDKVDFSQAPDKNPNVKEVVKRVLDIQIKRFGNYNAKVPVKILEEEGGFSLQSLDFLKKICSQKQLSGRAYAKALGVARTIADLDEKDVVENEHINEAIFFIHNPFLK